MINYFVGRTVEWLLTRRNSLQDALSRGAGTITHTAVAPGMYHEFQGMKQEELEEQLLRVLYALNQLDPDAYPDPAGQRCNLTLSQFG